MTQRLMSLDEIDKHIVGDRWGDRDLLILDTGGLIDIAYAARIAQLGKNRETEPKYSSALRFLTAINKKHPILILPGNYEEIVNHRSMMINGHNKELPDELKNFVDNAYKETIKIRKQLLPLTSHEQIHYDVYWAEKLAFPKDHKKMCEGFSNVDKEILTSSLELATGLSPVKEIAGNFRFDELDKHLEDGTCRRNFPIGIITSDSHIVRGTHWLKKEAGYLGVYIVPTRETR